jgi:hypothetical protein
MRERLCARAAAGFLAASLLATSAFCQAPPAAVPVMRPAQIGFRADLVGSPKPAPAAAPAAGVAAAPGVVAAPAPAVPKIHALLLGHARDQTIGSGVEVSGRLLENLLLTAFPGTELNLRCVGFPRTTRGPDAADGNALNHSTIDVAIDAMGRDVQPNDTVFCFVLAHGAFDSNHASEDYEWGHYFGMEQGSSYPRSSLFQKLKARSPRLTVLLSDSCNVKSDLPPVAAAAALAPPAAVARLQAFRTLILDHQGEVSINAASPNQFSFYSATEGGYFVQAFAETVRTSRENVTWQEFFTLVSAATQSVFVEGFRPFGGCPYAWDPVGRQVLTLSVTDPRTQKSLQPFPTRTMTAVHHVTEQVGGGAADPCESLKSDLASAQARIKTLTGKLQKEVAARKAAEAAANKPGVKPTEREKSSATGDKGDQKQASPTEKKD